jgi:hypothetical protein
MELATNTVTVQKLKPIIVNLGKTKPKKIKALKKGKGDLLVEIDQAVDMASHSLGAEADGKVFVPVVLLYKPKTKKLGLFS